MTDIETRVSELESRVAELEEKMESKKVTTSESDLTAFLDEVDPSTHVERATSIGFYLVHHKGRDSFKVGDIEDGYIETRNPKPANLSDVLNGAKDKGWLMETGSEGKTKLWTVTSDGDEAVNTRFES